MKKALVLILFLAVLAGCDRKPEFEIYEWEPTYGSRTTDEDYRDYDPSYDPESFKIVPVKNLQGEKRKDFMMAVDASMIKKVLDAGGVYYNEEGREQDVFEILALNGVNYLRVRIWNDPYSPIGVQGGGDMDLETAFWIASRARRVNMRIILDLHYSDTWADPETQTKPYDWELLTFSELVDAVRDFTYEAVKYFKERGVVPEMIQIGNEINNGLLWPDGRLLWNDPSSYDRVAELLKAGIAGAKAADKYIQTIIHLADGGKTAIFESFFEEMEKRKVKYDIIGASFYPFYHGKLSALQDNLNTISERFKKPVFVAETSYAYTLTPHDHAANIFGPNQEESGGYLATIQGQATAIRDIIEVVANVPKNRGLGICYWEPAWLPVRGAGWAEAGTKATWSNQAFFTYGGRALPSLKVFKAVREEVEVPVKIVGLKDEEIELTLNIASTLDSESEMPPMVPTLTDVDSYVYAEVEWEEDAKRAAEANVGDYVVRGVVRQDGKSWEITARVRSIQNYVYNPGFELDKRTANDEPVKAPWVLESNTDPNVGKVQTNKDFRTGSNNFNYYHTAAFDFELYQEIELPNGTYELSAWVMGESNMKIEEFYMYAKDFGGEMMRVDIKVSGWSAGYHRVVITGIEVTEGKITIGFRGRFNASTWGHIDDLELSKISAKEGEA